MRAAEEVPGEVGQQHPRHNLPRIVGAPKVEEALVAAQAQAALQAS